MQNNDEQLFLKRAIQISKLGRGKVSPNPEVGCILMSNKTIISEGWHQKYGEGHAEVNTLKDVDSKSLDNTSLYISLEPCSFIGKTPPCADLIIKSKIPKVVIANIDPNPKVQGNGIQKLKDVNIDVNITYSKQEGLMPFIKNQKYKRPYIILKWVKSQDGFIGKENEKVWLSNQFSTVLSHKWRGEIDAILVGKNTTLLDNPSLTTRHYFGNNPIRILLDSNLEIPTNFKIFNNDAKTIVINNRQSKVENNIEWVFQPQHLDELCKSLYERGIGILMVEGGTKVLQSFIDANTWDEARVITTPHFIFDGVKIPQINNNFHLFKKEKMDSDSVSYYRNDTLDTI